jgi:hypothetical protein
MVEILMRRIGTEKKLLPAITLPCSLLPIEALAVGFHKSK